MLAVGEDDDDDNNDNEVSVCTIKLIRVHCILWHHHHHHHYHQAPQYRSPLFCPARGHLARGGVSPSRHTTKAYQERPTIASTNPQRCQLRRHVPS